MSRTRAVNRRAMDLYAQWRREGKPVTLTADEAHRLSGGAIGRTGDHGNPVPLSAIAVRVATREQQNKKETTA